MDSETVLVGRKVLCDGRENRERKRRRRRRYREEKEEEEEVEWKRHCH